MRASSAESAIPIFSPSIATLENPVQDHPFQFDSKSLLLKRLQASLAHGIISRVCQHVNFGNDIFAKAHSEPPGTCLNWASQNLRKMEPDDISKLQKQAQALLSQNVAGNVKIAPTSFHEEANYLFKGPLLGSVWQIYQINRRVGLSKENPFLFEYVFLCVSLEFYIASETNPAKALNYLHDWCQETYRYEQSIHHNQRLPAHASTLQWMRIFDVNLRSPLARALLRLATIQNWIQDVALEPAKASAKNNPKSGRYFSILMDEKFKLLAEPPVEIFHFELPILQALQLRGFSTTARSNLTQADNAALRYGFDSPKPLEEIYQDMHAPIVSNALMIELATWALPPIIPLDKAERFRCALQHLSSQMNFRQWLGTLQEITALQEKIDDRLARCEQSANDTERLILKDPNTAMALTYMAEAFLQYQPNSEFVQTIESTVPALIPVPVSSSDLITIEVPRFQTAKPASVEPDFPEFREASSLGFEEVFTPDDLAWNLPLGVAASAIEQTFPELMTVDVEKHLASSDSQQALDNPTLEKFLPLRPDSRSLTESPWARLIEKNSWS